MTLMIVVLAAVHLMIGPSLTSRSLSNRSGANSRADSGSGTSNRGSGNTGAGTGVNSLNTNSCMSPSCGAGSCRAGGLLICEQPNVMTSLPSVNLPAPTTVRVILRYQMFSQPILSYSNLSQYGSERIKLNQLVLTHSNIYSIEPETFSHLMYLRHLDLSYNRLKIIQPRTFDGLTLENLILDNNENLQLTSHSLRGLLVYHLSLRNCSLNSLNYDTVKEVSGYLITLNLAHNQLKFIDSQFHMIFLDLKSLHLENNPFNCSCQLRWLSKTFKSLKNPNSLSVPPKCRYPRSMNNVPITTLLPSSFYCPVPKIERIDLRITSATTAELSCVSDISSDSQVKWRYKYIKSTMYYRYIDDDTKLNKASIKVTKNSPSDFYTCIIDNENGNSTVDIKIKWPKLASALNRSLSLNNLLPHSSPSTFTADNINNNNNNNKYPNQQSSLPATSTSISELERTKQQNRLNFDHSDQTRLINSDVGYLWLKQYTFMEMILAITGTFISTILTFILLFLILNYRRKNIRTKNALKGYEVGIYSDSQTYDIPQLSPYHESNNGRLLDFKTQEEIRPDW